MSEAPKGYVSVNEATRAVSGIVTLLCVLSLGLWFMSGFVIIAPLFAILTLLASVQFFALACVAIWREGRQSAALEDSHAE